MESKPQQISRSDSVKTYLSKIEQLREFLEQNITRGILQNGYQQIVDLANGYAQLEDDIQWDIIFQSDMLKTMQKYCFAQQTQLEYLLLPFFAMSGAVIGKDATVTVMTRNGPKISGRGNIYLLISGNPGSGKSKGFERAVSIPSTKVAELLKYIPIIDDASRSALLSELTTQDKEGRGFLIMDLASDEMAIKLCGEMKGGSDWQYKKVIYNNAFTGADINFGRMKGASSRKVVIHNPYLTIIGLGQPKPWMDFIVSLTQSGEGLLERFLFCVAKKQENIDSFFQETEFFLDDDWATQCLLALTKYHKKHPRKNYLVSDDDYTYLRQLEMDCQKEAENNWQSFLHHLQKGEIKEAIASRNDTGQFEMIRVLRFSVCVHISLHAIKACIARTKLGKIPTTIATNEIKFAASFVKHGFRQMGFFRVAAAALNSRSSGQKSEKVLEPKSGSLTSGLELNSDISHSDILSMKTFLPGRDVNILKKIVTFPAPYFTAKAIYRSATQNSKVIRQWFESFSKVTSGKQFIGKVVKLKAKKSKKYQMVLFRGPYSKVDQNLLGKCGISNQKDYEEQLMNADITNPSSSVRKATETKNTPFPLFQQNCEKMKPGFNDVPDWTDDPANC